LRRAGRRSPVKFTWEDRPALEVPRWRRAWIVGSRPDWGSCPSRRQPAAMTSTSGQVRARPRSWGWESYSSQHISAMNLSAHDVNAGARGTVETSKAAPPAGRSNPAASVDHLVRSASRDGPTRDVRTSRIMSADVPSTVPSGFHPPHTAARSGVVPRRAVVVFFDTATVSAGSGELSAAALGWAVGVRGGAGGGVSWLPR